MKMRRAPVAVWLALITMGIFLVAAPARAQQVPSQTVPVTVNTMSAPNDVPPIGGPLPIATATPLNIPTPDPSPVPTIDPNTFKVPASIFHPLLTALLTNITNKISPFLNRTSAVGWHLYTLIAAISIALGVLQTVLLGEFSLPALIRTLYWRLVEMGLWRMIIMYTWSGLPGGYGWFSAIIAGFVGIAGTIVGIDTSFTAHGWNLDVLPGTIADLGVSLFSAIMSMVSIGKGGLWDVLGRTMDGTVIASAVMWCFGLVSALYALFVCGYISFKYFWTVVKVYVLGCLSFIQGFAGSRRLGGIAGSYINSAIILGIETAVIVILVGLMWHVIIGLTQWLGFQQALDFVQSEGTPLPAGIVVGHLADLAYTGAALAILDLVLTLWAYAMWRVPRDVAELLSGKIQVQPGEVRQAFQSSPFFTARLAGTGANVLEQGGTKGPGAALGAAVKPIGDFFGKVGDLASVGAVAGSGNGSGAAGLASGAVKGFLMGGPEGAVVGAIGSAVMGKLSHNESEGGSYSGSADDAAEQHDERTNPNVRDAESGDGSAEVRSEASASADGGTATGRRNTIIEDDVSEGGGDTGASANTADLPSQHKTRRTQVDEELVTAMRAMTAALNANASGGGQNMAAAAAGGSRSATRTSSGFDPLSEMDANLSIGRMITQRAMYRQMRPPRQEPPHRDQESAALNIPVNLGR